MSSRFFELSDDVTLPGRWLLDDPVDPQGHALEDPRLFNRGQAVQVEGRLRVPVEHPGQALDFTQTALLAPVVHVRVATIFAELAPDDVHLIPADIEGQPDQYLVLVATKRIRCIDEERSQVQFWTADDGVPEKVGKYYAVDHLHIDTTQVGSAKVFRPEGWAGTLIVSEDLKHALERIHATGVRFTEV